MPDFVPHVPTVAPEQVTECLRALGLTAGSAVMLHSSLSSVGTMMGGAEGLVDGVLAAVEPGGTLAMPVMPDMFTPIDLSNSPGTVGRVGEALRLRPGARRSVHPTHSVVAVGGAAEGLVEGHENASPCGAGSPYAKLASIGGWALLFGVDLDRCTMMHTAEDLAGVPYLLTLELQVLGDDGQPHRVLVERMPNGHRAFIAVDRRLREAGVVRMGRVGNAIVRLIPASALLDISLELLAQDPAAFLCNRPRCVFCLWARAQVAAAQGAVAEEVDWAQCSALWGCRDSRCEVCYV